MKTTLFAVLVGVLVASSASGETQYAAHSFKMTILYDLTEGDGCELLAGRIQKTIHAMFPENDLSTYFTVSGGQKKFSLTPSPIGALAACQINVYRPRQVKEDVIQEGYVSGTSLPLALVDDTMRVEERCDMYGRSLEGALQFLFPHRTADFSVVGVLGNKALSPDTLFEYGVCTLNIRPN